jgi:CHAD domain-containing protein
MAGKLEIERKYQLPGDFSLPRLTGVGGVDSVGEADDLQLDATYYDTSELRLARERITLRRRAGGHDAGWHLKRPVGDERSELHVPASPSQLTPPSAIRDQVRALTRGEDLQPIARIRTHRVERALRAADGSTVALIADDDVTADSLLDGGTGTQWRELEIELVDGPREALDRLDAALRAAGARPAESPSKLARALGDAYPAPKADKRAGDDRRSVGRRTLAGYVRAQRDAIVALDPLVRDGDGEAVHKMRVATRRLRSTLRSFASLLPGDDLDRLHEEIKWLTGLLGKVRDGDVMADRLAQLVTAEPPELILGPVANRISQFLAARTAAARQQLIAGLDSERYLALLTDLDALVTEVSTRTSGRISADALRRRARKALRRAERKLTAAAVTPASLPDDGSPLPGQPTRDERLHESRKAYKRARYAVELIEPLAGKPARKLADRLTEMQDELGAHQDAIVTGELLRQYALKAYADGENAFSYGLLHARQYDQGMAVLAQLSKTHGKMRRAAAWL